ncbi:MAG: prepilin peptidase [Rhodovibrionaceae bacterium]|nr:prepilin peptidase [Rhodovibrionaceae bacterium]
MSGFYEIYLYTAFALFAAGFVAAGIYDCWRYIIPNWLVAALTGLFVVTALVLPFSIDWQKHLLAGAVFLAFGLFCFRFRLLGAGDGKLVAVGALWVGWDLALTYVIYTSLAGGAFAIGLVVLRKALEGVRYVAPANCTLRVQVPRLLMPSEGIPYGVAIAVGAIVVGRMSPMFEILW